VSKEEIERAIGKVTEQEEVPDWGEEPERKRSRRVPADYTDSEEYWDEHSTWDNPFELFARDEQENDRVTAQIKEVIKDLCRAARRFVFGHQDRIDEVEELFYGVLHYENEIDDEYRADSDVPLTPRIWDAIETAARRILDIGESNARVGIGDTATDEAIAVYLKRELKRRPRR